MTRALADFDRATKLGLRSATINLAEGIICVERHALNEAVAAFNRCREIDPERTDALVGLGMVHMMRANQDDALAAFDEAIKIDRRCDAAYGELARSSIASAAMTIKLWRTLTKPSE